MGEKTLFRTEIFGQNWRNIRNLIKEQGGYIVAPCCCNGECPIKENDWCAFYARVARSSIHRQAKGGNLGYEDEKLTNYINSLKNATTESQIRDIYKSIQKYVNENALFMNLVIRYDYIVTNRRIEGKISPNSFDIYEGITNLDIAK